MARPVDDVRHARVRQGRRPRGSRVTESDTTAADPYIIEAMWRCSETSKCRPASRDLAGLSCWSGAVYTRECCCSNLLIGGYNRTMLSGLRACFSVCGEHAPTTRPTCAVT